MEDQTKFHERLNELVNILISNHHKRKKITQIIMQNASKPYNSFADLYFSQNVKLMILNKVGDEYLPCQKSSAARRRLARHLLEYFRAHKNT